MSRYTPSRSERRRITQLVRHYVDNKNHFELVVNQLKDQILADRALMAHVHSIKWRVKDPEHLKDKLCRMAGEARHAGRPFRISKDNLFVKVNDLAGLRILHLHTRQMDEINRALLNRLDQALYPIIEGPVARTWDDESRIYFEEIGIPCVRKNKNKRPTLYTSVHYVIQAAAKTKSTCEIQVRTLADEVWGEVDHSLNYPYAVKSVACHEQIQVLARVTTSCSRLVDSIFKSFEESSRLRLHGRRRAAR